MVCALLVAAAGYLGWKEFAKPSGTTGHRLAILPFRNIESDAATDFLGFSLADAIITKLGYVSSLTVVPSSAIERYRNRTIDPHQAAAALNDPLLDPVRSIPEFAALMEQARVRHERFSARFAP